MDAVEERIAQLPVQLMRFTRLSPLVRPSCFNATVVAYVIVLTNCMNR